MKGDSLSLGSPFDGFRFTYVFITQFMKSTHPWGACIAKLSECKPYNRPAINSAWSLNYVDRLLSHAPHNVD